MTRRLLHLVAALNTCAVGGSFALAHTAHEHGSPLYTAVFATAAVLFAAAVAAQTYLADELRAALVRLELRTRPPDPIPRALRDDIALGWNDLETACCLRAWESRGAEHDPNHCTRKDTTT